MIVSWVNDNLVIINTKSARTCLNRTNMGLIPGIRNRLIK